MDAKTISKLEFPAVIERLAEYAAFSASADLGRALKPAASLKDALERQACTTEARLLLSLHADISVGGAHDIHPLADLASLLPRYAQLPDLRAAVAQADRAAAAQRDQALAQGEADLRAKEFAELGWTEDEVWRG